MGMRQYQIPRNKRALCNNKDFWKFGNPVCEPANEHWVWIAGSGDSVGDEPTPILDCPEDFLKAANSYGAPKPIWHDVGSKADKWGVDVIHGKDNWFYEVALANGDRNDTEVEFTCLAKLPGDASPRFTFVAVATRSSATDASPVPVNGSPRPAGK